MNQDSLGLIEVRGWVAAIVAGDAMVKAAKVRLLRQHSISPGLVTIVVEGDLGSCRAAVDAGMAAAERLGAVIARLVIGRPDRDTRKLTGPLLAAVGDGHRGFQGQRRKSVEVAMRSSVSIADTIVATLLVPQAATPMNVEISVGSASEMEATAVFSYIGSSDKGRTAQEVARHFKENSGAMRSQLEQWVAAGRLKRSGARYVIGTNEVPPMGAGS